MRDKIKVLYYPDMQVSETTLKKCILFFDEIHFMDRPALTIGNFGLIGAQSPLRAVEQSFREDAGVPLYGAWQSLERKVTLSTALSLQPHLVP